MENTYEIVAGICRVPEFGPDEIYELMCDLDMEERAFALLMNVETATVKMWMGGVAKPGRAARRLMQIYRDVPCIMNCLADVWVLGDVEDEMD